MRAATKALSCMIAVLGIFTSGESSPLDLHQGVIVHLFEWTYPQIALECEEFLAPHGFAGVQISPPTEHLKAGGQWWERYQPVSYQLMSRSGNEEQLRDMLTRCNRVGIRVFADVVFNHMAAAATNCLGVGGSTCNAKDFSYPAVPYTANDFHPVCSIKNYNHANEYVGISQPYSVKSVMHGRPLSSFGNSWVLEAVCSVLRAAAFGSRNKVRNCELVGLPDLDQSREYVRRKVVELLNHLIDIGIAGFRIDAAKHMHPSDLSAIYNKLKDLNVAHGFPAKTKPLIYQEVIDMGHEAVKDQEYLPLGLVTDFRFGSELGRCFQGWNDLKWLRNFGSDWNLLPGDRSIVFIENHDTERSDNKNILNYKNSRAYKMAVVFMLAWGYGSPKLHSGYKFSSFDQGPPSQPPRPISGNICSHGWECQHRWRQLYNAVDFHNVVKGTQVKSWWDNGKNQIAFCRGDKGFVAFNLENNALDQNLQTCLREGTYCDIISGKITSGKCSGKTIQVKSNGEAKIFISRFDPQSPDDGVLAIHIKSKVNSAA